MRADGYPQESWERLGRLLEERRGELNPDWANRAQFLRDTGMNKKLIERLELATPGHYRPATLAKVAVAYGWTADSIRRVLAGGQPQPRTPEPADGPLTAQDAVEARILAAGLPYAEKAAAIRRHREQQRELLADLGLEPGERPFVPDVIMQGIERVTRDGEPGDAGRGARLA